MNTMTILASNDAVLQRMIRGLGVVATVWVMTVLAQAVGLAQAPSLTTSQVEGDALDQVIPSVKLCLARP